jgi:hypothetical protein
MEFQSLGFGSTSFYFVVKTLLVVAQEICADEIIPSLASYLFIPLN